MWEVLGNKQIPHRKVDSREYYQSVDTNDNQSERIKNWQAYKAEKAMNNFREKGKLDTEIERGNTLFS